MRVNVTERPGDADRLPVKVQTPLFTEQRYTAILAEGPHLDRAVASLTKPGATAEEAVQAIRNIGKHGERVTQLVGGDVARVPGGKAGNLGDRLFQLAEDAKTGRAAERLAGDADALHAEIRGYLEELKGATGKATKTLRDESQLGKALTPAQMSELQAWSSLETNVVRYADQIDGTLPALFEGLKAAAHTAMEEEAQQSLPPENSSPAPDPPPLSRMARSVARAPLGVGGRWPGRGVRRGVAAARAGA